MSDRTQHLSGAAMAAAAGFALVAACLLSCAGPIRSLTRPVRAESGLTKASLPQNLSGNFSVAGPVEQYVPGDLWKKIDGAADSFLAYGFRRLLAGAFARPGASLPEIEVSIFEMDSDLNALGIYLQEKSEETGKVAVGWEGYRSAQGLFFHKGPCYVKIVDLSSDGSLGAVANDLARRIDASIRVERAAVAEMNAFPKEGLIADSILYEHRDAMGHGFLQRVFRADYDIGDKRATLFFTRQPNANQQSRDRQGAEEATKTLMAKYRDYGKEFGQIGRDWQDGDLHLLSIRAFNNPELVFVRGDVFGGIVGCDDEAAAIKLIRALLANLDRP
ncbi:hypothetical protein FJY63_04555 [Candidatus Sumerlaeota bacterium]|nr:hypothetical protein [Candidatus Sumerlaeota bacterium]